MNIKKQGDILSQNGNVNIPVEYLASVKEIVQIIEKVRMKVKLEWITEHKEIWQEVRDTRLKCFEDDLLKDYMIDIYSGIANGIIKDSDYALVKNENDEVIGTIGYYHNKDTKNCWINWFGILKEYRNKGYGEITLKTFERYIQDKEGIENFYLYTGKEVNKEACRLYKKCGYTMQKEVFTKEGENDIVIMGKSVIGEYKYWVGEPIW